MPSPKGDRVAGLRPLLLVLAALWLAAAGYWAYRGLWPAAGAALFFVGACVAGIAALRKATSGGTSEQLAVDPDRDSSLIRLPFAVIALGGSIFLLADALLTGEHRAIALPGGGVGAVLASVLLYSNAKKLRSQSK